MIACKKKHFDRRERVWLNLCGESRSKLNCTASVLMVSEYKPSFKIKNSPVISLVRKPYRLLLKLEIFV